MRLTTTPAQAPRSKNARRAEVPLTVQQWDSLPDDAMVDIKTVALMTGRSASSLWRDARTGKLPRPVKTGPACTRWNVGAIRRHLAALGATE